MLEFLKGRIDNNIGVVEKRLGKAPWLVGDYPTIADISIFSQLHYLYTTVNYEIPASYKNVHAFMENMRQTLKLNALADSFEAKSL